MAGYRARGTRIRPSSDAPPNRDRAGAIARDNANYHVAARRRRANGLGRVRAHRDSAAAVYRYAERAADGRERRAPMQVVNKLAGIFDRNRVAGIGALPGEAAQILTRHLHPPGAGPPDPRIARSEGHRARPRDLQRSHAARVDDRPVGHDGRPLLRRERHERGVDASGVVRQAKPPGEITPSPK